MSSLRKQKYALDLRDQVHNVKKSFSQHRQPRTTGALHSVWE